eukprot:1843217-Pleurochrysis_carterae.AAC.2
MMCAAAMFEFRFKLGLERALPSSPLTLTSPVTSCSQLSRRPSHSRPHFRPTSVVRPTSSLLSPLHTRHPLITFSVDSVINS